MILPASRRSRRVFVDTSAYVALLGPRDDRHAEAVRIVEKIADDRLLHYTTNVMLIEGHAMMLSRLGRTAARAFLTRIEESRTVVVRARAQDEWRAVVIIDQYHDKDFSFADAISFAVMERLAITQAFTFDRHFEQAGFTVVRA